MFSAEHGSGQRWSSYHVYCAEHMAVVVAGLQVLGDVGKCTQILWVLCCTRNISDLMLRNNVLHKEERQYNKITSLEICSNTKKELQAS